MVEHSTISTPSTLSTNYYERGSNEPESLHLPLATGPEPDKLKLQGAVFANEQVLIKAEIFTQDFPAVEVAAVHISNHVGMAG